MKRRNFKDRVKGRRLEALDRRLEDITTLEGGDIPGWEDTPKAGELHGSTASRVVKEKLERAKADVDNLKRILA